MVSTHLNQLISSKWLVIAGHCVGNPASDPSTLIEAYDLNFKHLSPWTKWPAFRRQYFQVHFREWKLLYFDWYFIEFCSLGSNWQKLRIGLYNGLAPNRRQAIIWTNAVPIHWRINAALGTMGRYVKQRDPKRHHHYPPTLLKSDVKMSSSPVNIIALPNQKGDFTPTTRLWTDEFHTLWARSVKLQVYTDNWGLSQMKEMNLIEIIFVFVWFVNTLVYVSDYDPI